MPKEWYVSFHGGEEKTSLNNIHVYSADGKKLRKALNKKSLPKGVRLRELRGFAFGPDKDLYVVNAYFEYSEVVRFRGPLNNDGQHDFVDVFVKRHAELNPGIDHPFNVAFDFNGDLYVSSQNTNLVARYHGPLSKTGKPGLGDRVCFELRNLFARSLVTILFGYARAIWAFRLFKCVFAQR